MLQQWKKRWLVLRRPSPGSGGSVRLEKYENEEAAGGYQVSSHCAVYDLGLMCDIAESIESSKHVITMTFDDYTTVHISPETSKFDMIRRVAA